MVENTISQMQLVTSGKALDELSDQTENAHSRRSVEQMYSPIFDNGNENE